MDGSWLWTDAHFSCLQCQTNVYGLAKFVGADGTNKLLVGCISGKAISVEYQKIFDKLRPSSREIQFTYIPGDAEIVSIDAFRKCHHGDELIIGIAFLKLEENESKPSCQFLNIYSSWEPDEKLNLDSVAQVCQNLKLEFVPYQLTHTKLVTEKTNETVFLLSGSDSQVHLYREVGLQHTFSEEAILKYFPEFDDITSSILWIDIVYTEKYEQRITARSHQNGEVLIFLVDALKQNILKRLKLEHDGPITRVLVFKSKNKVPVPTALHPFVDAQTTSEKDVNDVLSNYNLLVTSAVEPAVIYRNILQNKLNDLFVLPDSDKFDSVMCACAVDIDFDGQNELLLGTYGQELLSYKFFPSLKNFGCDNNCTSKASVLFSEGNSSKVSHKLSLSEAVEAEEMGWVLTPSSSYTEPCEVLQVPPEEGYHLLWQRSFASPVMAVDHADVMGDGMDDLIVLTLRGLHILQPDLSAVARICLNRLQQLLNKEPTPET